MAANTNEAWAHCNKCNGHTRHKVICTENVKLEDDVGDRDAITYWDSYTLLRCLGCDTVHLKHDSAFSEAVDDKGRPEVTTTIYPPRISRNKPNWLGSLAGPFWWGDFEIEQLLDEIYVALHNNSLRLAAMGVRALLEYIMIDKVGEKGSIGANITAFIEAGYVAPKDQDFFRTKLIEAGHAAMHRGYKPEQEDLGGLLDVTEFLIASIYVHPVRTKNLDKRIPPRGAARRAKP